MTLVTLIGGLPSSALSGAAGAKAGKSTMKSNGKDWSKSGGKVSKGMPADQKSHAALLKEFRAALEKFKKANDEATANGLIAIANHIEKSAPAVYETLAQKHKTEIANAKGKATSPADLKRLLDEAKADLARAGTGTGMSTADKKTLEDQIKNLQDKLATARTAAEAASIVIPALSFHISQETLDSLTAGIKAKDAMLRKDLSIAERISIAEIMERADLYCAPLRPLAVKLANVQKAITETQKSRDALIARLNARIAGDTLAPDIAAAKTTFEKTLKDALAKPYGEGMDQNVADAIDNALREYARAKYGVEVKVEDKEAEARAAKYQELADELKTIKNKAEALATRINKVLRNTELSENLRNELRIKHFEIFILNIVANASPSAAQVTEAQTEVNAAKDAMEKVEQLLAQLETLADGGQDQSQGTGIWANKPDAISQDVWTALKEANNVQAAKAALNKIAAKEEINSLKQFLNANQPSLKEKYKASTEGDWKNILSVLDDKEVDLE